MGCILPTMHCRSRHCWDCVASVCIPLPTRTQPQGRYIFLEAYIQDSPYFILNIYAPNKCSEKFLGFFKDVLDILKDARAEQDHPFIVGGDFNIILDHVIDGQGGNSKRKDSGNIIKDISAELDLVDI